MSERWILRNAMVFDAVGTEVFPGAVTVDKGVITAIEPYATSPRDGDRVIDCQGGVLLPGLIDAHVHLGAIDLQYEQQHRRYPTSYIALKMAEQLRTFLSRGFTTVRDAGGADWGIKLAIEQGVVPGPRVFISGRPITQTGGHGDVRSPSEPGHYHFDGEIGMTHSIADGVDGVRRAVREELRRGADAVKLYTSGGPASPAHAVMSASGQMQYSLAEIKVAVEEAARAGAYVLAHAIPRVAIEACIESGVRSIEHGYGLDVALAERMAELGTFLVPTVAWYDTAAYHAERFEISERVSRGARVAIESTVEAVRIAHAAGVSVGFGSDLCGPTVERLGESLGLQARASGVYETLISATRVNAELLGISEDYGTVEVGKRADLVVMAAGVLEDLSLLEEASNVQLVMQHGIVYRNEFNEGGR